MMRMKLSVGTTLLASALVAAVASAKDSAPLPANVAVPKVYVVPMDGQMGTDIAKVIYDEIAKDIEKQKPDILVMHVDTSDFAKGWEEQMMSRGEKPERGLSLVGEYRDIAMLLREDLRQYPQVAWVNNAAGWGSLLAMSWPTVYMTPEAKLVGVYFFTDSSQFQDEHVAAKMQAAKRAIALGFMELGGYPLDLGDALLFPQKTLSASFEGRSVHWQLDNNGMWVVDSSEKAATVFTAKLAEDTLLSDGTAENLDDLMFLLGYREYQHVDSGEKLFKKYKDDWRQAYEKSIEYLRDAESADSPSQRKALLEKVVSRMKSFPAVERRLASEGVSKLELEVEIDQLKESSRQNRNSGGTAGGGRSGKGGGFGSPR